MKSKIALFLIMSFLAGGIILGVSAKKALASQEENVLYDASPGNASSSGNGSGNTNNSGGSNNLGNSSGTNGTGNSNNGSSDKGRQSSSGLASSSTTMSGSGSIIFTDSGITELQQSIANTQTEKAQIQTLLNGMMKNQNDFIKNLQEIDDEILKYQDKLDKMSQQQEVAKNTVKELNGQMSKAQDSIDKQYDILKKHIQEEYENGNYGYFDILFSTKKDDKYIDLNSKIEYIQAIDTYDEKSLTNLKDAKQTLANKQALFGSLSDDIDNLSAAYTTEQDNLSVLSDAKEEQINDYQSAIDSTKADLETIEEMENQQNDQIAAIELKYKTALIQNQTNNGTTSLQWPMPSSSVITSKFGPRTAPTEGATTDHKGIDISCATGSEVTAAADGVVIYTDFLGTGGNAVIINHGGGLVTCYFHLSAFNCSVGDNVKAGQVIAYSGSTGVSTGPHLHFAVRLNGTYVDPLGYLGVSE